LAEAMPHIIFGYCFEIIDWHKLLSSRIPSGSLGPSADALELRMSQNKFRAPDRLPPVLGAGWDFSKTAAALSTPSRKFF
jgi:hypothetical protein